MPRKRRRKQRKLPNSHAPQRGTLRLGLVLLALTGINLYVFLWRGGTSIPDVMERAAVAGEPTLGGVLTSGDFDLPEEDASPNGAGTVDPGSETGGVGGDDEGGIWADGSVQKNDSMAVILAREGFDPNAAQALINSLKPHMDFRKIHPGQVYRLRKDSAGQWNEFEFHVSRTTQARAVRATDGAITAELNKAATEIRPAQVGGVIESSLYHSIKAIGEDTRMVSFFVDVFAYDLNFYVDQHKGDTFKMIVEKEFLNGEFLRYGRVLAAEWSGKAGTFRAFSWRAPGAKRAEYYDAKGRSVAKTFLKSPLKFTRISSKFNRRRMHPVLHRVKGHHGVDYAAPTGTPVWAAASGKIMFRGRRGGAGNAVIVRHNNGLSTIYMHLSKFKKGQKVGQRVRQKQIIGYVGMTGLATGPHLHFGVKKKGRYIDPMKMKMARSASVPRKFKGQFEADTARLVSELGKISPAAPAGRGDGATQLTP